MNKITDWGISLNTFDSELATWGREIVEDPKIDSGSIFLDNLPNSLIRGLLKDDGSYDMVKVENLFNNKAQQVIDGIVRVRKVLQHVKWDALPKDSMRDYLQQAVYRAIQMALQNTWNERTTSSSLQTSQITIQQDLSGWMTSSDSQGTAAWTSIMLSEVHKLEIKCGCLYFDDKEYKITFQTGEELKDVMIITSPGETNVAVVSAARLNEELDKKQGQIKPDETAETVEIQTVDLDDIVLRSELALDSTGGAGSIGKQIDAKIKVVDDKVLTESNELKDFKTKTEQQIKDLSVAQINGGLATDGRLTAIEKKQKDDEAEDVLLQAEISGLRTAMSAKVDDVDLTVSQKVQDDRLTALEVAAAGGFKGNFDKDTIADIIATPESADFAWYKISLGETTVLGTTVAYDAAKPWIRLEPTGTPLAWKPVSPLKYLANQPFNNLTAAEVKLLITTDLKPVNDRVKFVEDDVVLINDDIIDIKGELLKKALKTDVTELQATVDDNKADILDIRATADDAITDKQNNLKASTLDALGINADSSVKQPLATEDDFIVPFTKGLKDQSDDAWDLAFDVSSAKVVKSDNTETQAGLMNGTGATEDAREDKKLVTKKYVDEADKKKADANLKVINSKDEIVDISTMISEDGDTADDADARLVTQEYVDELVTSIKTSSGGGSVKYVDIKTGQVKDHIKKMKDYTNTHFAKVSFHRNGVDISRLGQIAKARWNVLSTIVGGSLVLPDGKILVAGNDGSAVVINPDGSVAKTKWAALSAPISSLTVLQDGKVLLAGGKATILNTDFTVSKAPWTAFTSKRDGQVLTASTLQNGKIFLGGGFSGEAEGTAVIINPDGSVSKAEWPALSTKTYCSLVLPDGKILVAGRGGKAIVLNQDGSVAKAEWTILSGTVLSLTLLQDGKIFVGGDGGNAMVLNQDFTVAKAEWLALSTGIKTSSILQDGKIFIGGDRGKAVVLNSDFTVSKAEWNAMSGTLKSSQTLSDGKIFVVDERGSGIILYGASTQHDHETVISWDENNGKVWIINASTGVNEDIGSVVLDGTHTLSIQYMDETKGVITDVETGGTPADGTSGIGGTP